MEDKESKNKENWQKVAAKYSSLAFQMGLIIGGFTYLGVYLDDKFNGNGKTQWFTLVFSLLGVALSLYTTLKRILKDQDNG